MALLPKISNALAKFVTPVGQSEAQTKTGMQPHQSTPQLPTPPKQAKKKPDLKLVPPVNREPEEEESPEHQDSPSEQKEFQRFTPASAKFEPLAPAPSVEMNSAAEKSVASKLLDIFRSFQDGKQSISKWSGNRVYKEMTKDEQKGKFRRGAMLDEKIE